MPAPAALSRSRTRAIDSAARRGAHRVPGCPARVGRGRLAEGELGGRQRGQRQLAEQAEGDPAAAADVPAAGERGRDRRHLAAADRQPAPVERPPERQLDRLRAVPGAHQRGALVGQQVQRPGERGGRAGQLQQQRHAAGRQARRRSSVRGDGGDAQRGRPAPGARPRVGGDHGRPGPLQQQGGDHADRAEPQHDDGLAAPPDPRRGSAAAPSRPSGNSVAARGSVPGGQRDDVVLGDDEPVLVRVEREDQRPRRHRAGRALDLADAAVAVGERIAEGAAERPDALVQREVRVELAAVGEQLGAGADPRVRACGPAARPGPGSGRSTGASSTRRGATNSSRTACTPFTSRVGFAWLLIAARR